MSLDNIAQFSETRRRQQRRTLPMAMIWLLVVQDHVQQRAMDAQDSIVFDKAKPAEFVHKKADSRARSADHLGQGLLADLRNNRLRFPFFPKVGQEQEQPSQAFFTRIE